MVPIRVTHLSREWPNIPSKMRNPWPLTLFLFLFWLSKLRKNKAQYFEFRSYKYRPSGWRTSSTWLYLSLRSRDKKRRRRAKTRHEKAGKTTMNCRVLQQCIENERFEFPHCSQKLVWAEKHFPANLRTKFPKFKRLSIILTVFFFMQLRSEFIESSLLCIIFQKKTYRKLF